MKPFPVLALLAAVLLSLGGTGEGRASGGECDANTVRGTARCHSEHPLPGSGLPSIPGSETLEEAREELAAGRYWHAAEVLMALEGSGQLTPEGKLLLARARAGYRDWEGVRGVLEEADWIESSAPISGGLLLARALLSTGDPEAAFGSYGRILPRLPADSTPFPALAGAVTAAVRSGKIASALEVLDERRVPDPVLTSALAWELSRELAEAGDTAGVRALRARVTTPTLRNAALDFPARAALAAGDSGRAESLFASLAAGAQGGTFSRYSAAVGDLALARGDSAAARVRYREALLATRWGTGAARAAAGLVRLDALDDETDLRAARVLDRSGDGGGALKAYDRYVASARSRGLEPEPGARVERARLASTVPSRVQEAVREFRALDEHPDARVGARALDVWAGLRRRQGQAENVRILRRWLVERYPDTDQAARVVFLRGDAAQDRRNWQLALARYDQVASMAPDRALAGRARMRRGQIQAQIGNPDEAIRTFEAYLTDFPQGRRWAEASFWAARLKLQQGDTAGAAALVERVREAEPYSYYAAESARLMGDEYVVAAPPAPVLEDVPWVGSALENLELMNAAELDAAAGIQLEAWVNRADGEGPAAQYPLAEGLIQGGWSIEGINRGWAMVREGEPWTARLVRILYPFPRREMVIREAEEYGLDPFLVAALIRQESAWDRDIVSSAGAVGLMQVMPATGRQIARAVGPEGFTPASLETAEVNLHLGARFLRDMLDRFGPELPLVLSAYNAGPTRANRWSRFPEARDPLVLTERIPFTETRGYVKKVTRNLAIYRALYGEQSGAVAAP